MQLAVGLALTMAATWLVQGLLFEVRPTDPTTLIGVALALLVVAMLAGLVPARRAIRSERPCRDLVEGE